MLTNRESTLVDKRLWLSVDWFILRGEFVSTNVSCVSVPECYLIKSIKNIEGKRFGDKTYVSHATKGGNVVFRKIIS